MALAQKMGLATEIGTKASPPFANTALKRKITSSDEPAPFQAVRAPCLSVPFHLGHGNEKGESHNEPTNQAPPNQAVSPTIPSADGELVPPPDAAEVAKEQPGEQAHDSGEEAEANVEAETEAETENEPAEELDPEEVHIPAQVRMQVEKLEHNAMELVESFVHSVQQRVHDGALADLQSLVAPQLERIQGKLDATLELMQWNRKSSDLVTGMSSKVNTFEPTGLSAFDESDGAEGDAAASGNVE